MAARLLVAAQSVLDILHCVQTDKARRVSLLPEGDRLQRRADRTGLAAVFVHDDPWSLSLAEETVFDEVDLCFYGGQIFLRSPLENEVRSQ